MFNETRTPCLIGCTEMGKEMKKSKKRKKEKKKLEMKIFFHMLFGCEEEKKRKEV